MFVSRPVLIVLLVVAVGSSAYAAPPPPELVRAATARIDLAQSLATRLMALYPRGLVPLDRVMEAYRSWFIACREAPLPAAKLADAATAYRAYVAKAFEITTGRNKSGAVGDLELLKVQSDLAEADFWLAEAKWKASP
jgi:hypothetical protein